MSLSSKRRFDCDCTLATERIRPRSSLLSDISPRTSALRATTTTMMARTDEDGMGMGGTSRQSIPRGSVQDGTGSTRSIPSCLHPVVVPFVPFASSMRCVRFCHGRCGRCRRRPRGVPSRRRCRLPPRIPSRRTRETHRRRRCRRRAGTAARGGGRTTTIDVPSVARRRASLSSLHRRVDFVPRSRSGPPTMPTGIGARGMPICTAASPLTTSTTTTTMTTSRTTTGGGMVPRWRRGGSVAIVVVVVGIATSTTTTNVDVLHRASRVVPRAVAAIATVDVLAASSIRGKVS